MSLKRFFHRNRWDDERARELEAHLAIEIDENIARGMSPDDARFAAQRRLGNATIIREDCEWSDASGSGNRVIE